MIVVHPLDRGRWDDLAALFGPRGAYGGCWCMDWRLSRAEYDPNGGNRERLRALAERPVAPGLIAYRQTPDQPPYPAGWCTLGPRAEFPRLATSPAGRTTARADDGGWVVPCFFVHRTLRRQGIAKALLAAAVEYAREHGATCLDGYPRERPINEPVNLCVGTEAFFAGAGFHPVERPTRNRVVMRRDL